MHDLRHDPNVTFVTWCDSHGVMQEIDVRTPLALDPADLRISAPMPDLRSPIARTLDAQRRHLEHVDCRTVDERVTAELVRLVDCLQAVSLHEELDRTDIAELRTALEYVAQHLGRLERAAAPDDYIGAVDYWRAVQHLAVQRLGELSAAGVAV